MSRNIIKKEELMVGDWVMCDPNVFIENEYEPTHPMYPTKIESGEYIDCAENDCYSPIKLTSEILEKIGFKKYNEYEYRLEYSEMIVSISEEPTTFYLYIESMAYTLTIEMCIDYVHELQHVFKLCYMEVEFDLNI